MFPWIKRLRVFRPFVLAGLLVLVSIGAFYQVGKFEFIHYDDYAYIRDNPYIREGLTWEGVCWAFKVGLTETNIHADYWQPMTFLSRMLDIQLFGLNAGGHHLANLFYHILNTLLVFFILRRISKATLPSFFVALYFCIHPLQVQPVAWVTARKDLLSSFFALLAIVGYLDYRKRNYKGSYLFSLFFFVLGLLSKSTVAILPVWLLLIDLWLSESPGNENKKPVALKRLLLDKGPFFLLSVLSLTAFRSQPQALNYPWQNSLPRVLGGYLHNLGRVIAPWDLGIHGAGGQYVLPAFWEIVLFLALLGFFSIAGIRRFKKDPTLFVGWFWFLAGLIPVIGLSPESDRYMYLPGIGVWIMIVWWIWGIIPADKGNGPHRAVVILSSLGVLCAVTSIGQLRFWRNDDQFTFRCFEINPHNYEALIDMGNYYFRKKQYAKALEFYQASIRVNPYHAMAYNNIGTIFAERGMYRESEYFYKLALRYDPNSEMAYCNLGSILLNRGEVNEAYALYRKGLQLEPKSLYEMKGLGAIFLLRGDYQKAEKYFLKALLLTPDDQRIKTDLSIIREIMTSQNKPANPTEPVSNRDKSVAAAEPAFTGNYRIKSAL